MLNILLTPNKSFKFFITSKSVFTFDLLPANTEYDPFVLNKVSRTEDTQNLQIRSRWLNNLFDLHHNEKISVSYLCEEVNKMQHLSNCFVLSCAVMSLERT